MGATLPEFGAGADVVILYLLADDLNQPGAVLEEFVINGQLAAAGGLGAVASGQSALHPLLLSGSAYWLAMGVPDLVNDRISLGRCGAGLQPATSVFPAHRE